MLLTSARRRLAASAVPHRHVWGYQFED